MNNILKFVSICLISIALANCGYDLDRMVLPELNNPSDDIWMVSTNK